MCLKKLAVERTGYSTACSSLHETSRQLCKHQSSYNELYKGAFECTTHTNDFDMHLQHDCACDSWSWKRPRSVLAACCLDGLDFLLPDTCS